MTSTSYAFLRTVLLGTSCLSLAVALAAPAHGQPAGSVIAAGQASITNSSGNLTTVRQTTAKALINWQSFSVAAGETVQFVQPGSSAITLNRVLGSDPSAIFGNLFANGQVWLINSNGILFGKGSKTNVGGLIATTADIADRDFMSGNYSFSSASGAAVVNQGSVRTSNGGSAILSGARVANEGIITADSGTVVLGGAGAFTVDFDGDNLLRYAITSPAGQASGGPTGVSNSGTIQASGGHVLMTVRAAANIADAVVNNSGMITATSASVQNGEVVLDAGGGTASVSGSINASGTASGETGGSVAITGANVNVADDTQINVSGDAGGGSVRIGGDAHGAGPLQNADNTTVGAATIKADAINSGNGGSLVVWSNGTTNVSGRFSATGGASGGNGGSLETSGHILNIAPSATVDTLAPKGVTGDWLLDPPTINIESAGTDPISGSNISPTTLVNALQLSDVTLQATSAINVLSSVAYSKPTTLNLLSQGTIVISASVQNGGTGAINLVAGWDGSTLTPAQFGSAGVYGNAGGDLSIVGSGTGVALGSHGGATNVYAANVTLDGTNGFAQLGYHAAGGGDINVLATGALTLTAGTGATDFALIGNGSTIADVAGNITGNININVQGAATLTSSSSAGNVAWIGNQAENAYSETGNVVFISSRIHSDGNGPTFNAVVESGLSGGDYTVGITDPTSTDSLNTPTDYNSAHTLNILSSGSFAINAPLQNSGNGAINIVTGWDGHTLTPASFGNAGVYGNNAGGLTVGGVDAVGSAAVGSAGGTTSLYGASISLSATNGYAQIGYHGAGGGDINIVSSGTLDLSAGTGSTDFAMIGNGSPLSDVAGNITGNINVKAVGVATFTSTSDTGSIVWVGNIAQSPATETGNVVYVAYSTNNDNSATDFGTNIRADLNGGDFTYGQTDPTADSKIDKPFVYNSPHALNILIEGSFGIWSTVQNSGNGAINLVAGWDGTTLNPAHFADTGVFGNNGGSVIVGSASATGSATIGSAGGATQVFGSAVTLDASVGDAQIGFSGSGGGAVTVVGLTGVSLIDEGNDTAKIGNGVFNTAANSSGNISVSAPNGIVLLSTLNASGSAQIGNGAYGQSGNVTGNVTVSGQSVLAAAGAGTTYVQIGNGGPNATGSFGGNVLVTATAGVIDLSAPSNAYAMIGNGGSRTVGSASGTIGVNASTAILLDGSGGGFVQIGNGGYQTNLTPSAGFSDTGDITINAADVSLVSSTTAASSEQIGNGGALAGLSTGGSTSGSIAFGGNILINASQSISISTSFGNSFAQIGNGGAAAASGVTLTGGSTSFSGNITLNIGTVSQAGALLLTGSGATSTTNDVSMIGNGGPGTGQGSTASQGISATGDIAVTVLGGSNHGATVDLTAVSTAGPTFDLAGIGNLSFGNVTGNIALTADGDVQFNSGTNASAYIGTFSNIKTSSGNLTVIARSLTGIDLSLPNDISNGDVLIEITGPATFSIATNVDYTSAHTLTLLDVGDIQVDNASIQNAGSGVINIVSGWNGTTTNSAHFGDTGVYGNNDSTFSITGGATGAAVGSNAGATNVYADNVSIIATNSYAQLGYNGSGGGAINLVAAGDVNVINQTGATQFAMIGNGGSSVAGNVGGAITVNAAGNVTIDERADSGDNPVAALIGNMGGGGTSSQSGNISVTAGQALTVDVSGAGGLANIGNMAYANTTGGATGNITAHSAALTIEDLGDNGRAVIGDGGNFTNGGATGGNIAITTGTLDMLAPTSSSRVAQARITNRGRGSVTGDISVVASGNIYETAGDGSLVEIGNGENGSATTSGNIAVQSGGAITLAATGAGEARIAAAAAPNSNISVTATGDVTLATSVDDSDTVFTGAKAFIGDFYGNASLAIGGNVSVTSTNGAISLLAGEDQSTASIGNSGGSPTSGTVTVSASNGLLTLEAGGAGADAIIGNGGDVGDVSGNVTVSAANIAMTADGSASLVQIGNGGPLLSGNAGGDVSVTASGTLDLVAGGEGSFVQIGNGDALHTGASNGNVSGNTNVHVTGMTTLNSGAGTAWIGNIADGAGIESGTVLLVSGDLDGGSAFNQNVVADLGGGDVTIGVTDPLATGTIDQNVIYNSAHTFNVLHGGNLVFAASVQNAGSGAINIVAGWDGTTVSPGSFANAGVFGNNGGTVIIGGSGALGNVAIGSAGGPTSVLASGVSLLGSNGYAQLGYHGAGGGAINLTSSHDLSMTTTSGYAMVGNGSLNNDVSGNVTGDINIHVAGIVHDNAPSGPAIFYGNATSEGTATGNLTFVMSSEDGMSSDTIGSSVTADIVGGDVTIGFTTSLGNGIQHDYSVSSAHTLSILSAGDVTVEGELQNSGTGAINLVAGWDGHTLTPSAFGNSGVFGNNGHTVLIGGGNATAGSAVGSAGGTTSVYAASLAVTAANGFAQLGFSGPGTGALMVDVTGGVTVTGGSSAGQFAQIGNGGRSKSGNNGGNIGIAAGGDLILSGGAGAEAYAQIGHGGAESNSNGSGYSNVAPITVSAANLLLNAGSGQAGYAQIGNGGYKSGSGLTAGTATNGGDITITSGHAVGLQGNGADAYAQIGNGGSQSNLNPAAAAGGVDSGNIVVQAPNGSAGAVTLTAGAGANAYAQIGNGGYSVNAGANATIANFTVSGNVSVTDLALGGGNSGGNAYAQIGNGDAALASYGNVGGNILVDANGNIVLANGSAAHSPAEIGNFTGNGTVSGTVGGVAPPGSTVINDPVTQGVIVSQTATPPASPITTIETDVVPAGPIVPVTAGAPDVQTPAAQGPIAQLSDNEGDTPNTSDSATVIVADSLDGSTKAAITQQILGGYLTQIIPAAGGLSVHGIRSVDQDFSSWGNEALWQ